MKNAPAAEKMRVSMTQSFYVCGSLFYKRVIYQRLQFLFINSFRWAKQAQPGLNTLQLYAEQWTKKVFLFPFVYADEWMNLC